MNCISCLTHLSDDDADGDGTTDNLDSDVSVGNAGDIIVTGGPGCSSTDSNPSGLWFLILGVVVALRRPKRS